MSIEIADIKSLLLLKASCTKVSLDLILGIYLASFIIIA
jgi:hypothetical protein